MEYSKIIFNNKGKQISFPCEVCGKYFSLDEIHYDSYDKYRVCDACFVSYRNNRFANIMKENKAIVEEMLKLRAAA